jgi:hypothetical protein
MAVGLGVALATGVDDAGTVRLLAGVELAVGVELLQALSAAIARTRSRQTDTIIIFE